MTRLSTERLTLRRARLEDLDALFAIFSDAEVMRFWSSPPHADLAVTQAMLDRWLSGGGPVRYFVWEHEGRVIGAGGAPGEVEVGYILGRGHWGQGFAQEAMGRIIAHLWDTTDWPHLTADVDPRNRASVLLLTRLGFTVTGYAARTFYVAGEWSDSVYFRLPRP